MKLNKIIIGVSALLVAGAASAWAASSSASISLSGTVAEVTTASSSAVSVNLATDLATGFTDFVLATLHEKCNKKNGYTVAIATANAADNATYYLKGTLTGSGEEQITYTLKHGSDAFTKDLDHVDYAKTGGSGVDVDLKMTVVGGNYSADTYTDTITVTISGK